MGCTAAVAAGLWGVWNPDSLDTTFTVVEVASVMVGLGAFVAARGCFVDVDRERATLRDVIAWVTVRRVRQDSIFTVRVRAGAWRSFELELDDGTLLVVAGASPAQFPARLMPGAAERDLADLDLLAGRDPAVHPDPGTTAPDIDRDGDGEQGV